MGWRSTNGTAPNYASCNKMQQGIPGHFAVLRHTARPLTRLPAPPRFTIPSITGWSCRNYWGKGPQDGIWAAPSPVGIMTGCAPWRVVT